MVAGECFFGEDILEESAGIAVFCAILAEQSRSDSPLRRVAAAAHCEELGLEGIAVGQNLAIEIRGEDEGQFLATVLEYCEIAVLLVQTAHAGDGIIRELQERAEFDGRGTIGSDLVRLSGRKHCEWSVGEGAACRCLRVRHPCLFPGVQ
ncbi:hypothetical protein LBMAG46_08370 [Planctomycetia bacterium]|nr:hypothetical protein LBMAG46_08370 [Planctomycetia bacterium]